MFSGRVDYFQLYVLQDGFIISSNLDLYFFAERVSRTQYEMNPYSLWNTI